MKVLEKHIYGISTSGCKYAQIESITRSHTGIFLPTTLDARIFDTGAVITLLADNARGMELDDEITWCTWRLWTEFPESEYMRMNALIVVQQIYGEWVWCYEELHHKLSRQLVDRETPANADRTVKAEFRIRPSNQEYPVWSGRLRTTLETVFGQLPATLEEDVVVEVYDEDAEDYVTVPDQEQLYIRMVQANSSRT